jgi:molybdopterin molybdotransferase
MSPSSRDAHSCCDEGREPSALSVEEARSRIFKAVSPVRARERLPLRSALGRTLAQTVTSGADVPAHTNSAMDGFALRGADLDAQGSSSLSLTGEALAGHPFGGRVGPGECVRIMTGAPLPEGADTVVMREVTEETDDRVRIVPGQRPGQNVRQAGEDIARGETVLGPGRVLTPADLGMLASLGVAEVEVLRRPRIAFFSTGDELRSLGEPLAEGELYDSNRYSLYGMLARQGMEIRDLGVVRDDPDALREAFLEAADGSDALITSGGVSVGDADHVKSVLQTVGQADFWKIAMKPGRPLTFGRLGDALFFGLPGNPVAVMVTFYQFLQPALERLAGRDLPSPPSLQARCTEHLRKRPGRTEFLRGVLSTAYDGTLEVRRAGRQGSGILRSMSLANCFVVLPEEASEVSSGDSVSVQPFQGLI